MAQPGIEVRAVDSGEWEIGIEETSAAVTTVFTAVETLGLLARLQAQYGR